MADVRVAGARIDFFARTRDLIRGLDRVRRDMRRTQSATRRFARSAAGQIQALRTEIIGTVAAYASLGGIQSLASGLGELASQSQQFANTAAAVGLTVNEYSRLVGVVRQYGVEQDDLRQLIVTVGVETRKEAEALREYGFEVSEAAGEVERFSEFLDFLARQTTGRRLTIAAEIAGEDDGPRLAGLAQRTGGTLLEQWREIDGITASQQKSLEAIDAASERFKGNIQLTAASFLALNERRAVDNFDRLSEAIKDIRNDWSGFVESIKAAAIEIAAAYGVIRASRTILSGAGAAVGAAAGGGAAITAAGVRTGILRVLSRAFLPVAVVATVVEFWDEIGAGVRRLAGIGADVVSDVAAAVRGVTAPRSAPREPDLVELENREGFLVAEIARRTRQRGAIYGDIGAGLEVRPQAEHLRIARDEALARPLSDLVAELESVRIELAALHADGIRVRDVESEISSQSSSAPAEIGRDGIYRRGEYQLGIIDSGIRAQTAINAARADEAERLARRKAEESRRAGERAIDRAIRLGERLDREQEERDREAADARQRVFEFERDLYIRNAAERRRIEEDYLRSVADLSRTTFRGVGESISSSIGYAIDGLVNDWGDASANIREQWAQVAQSMGDTLIDHLVNRPLDAFLEGFFSPVTTTLHDLGVAASESLGGLGTGVGESLLGDVFGSAVNAVAGAAAGGGPAVNVVNNISGSDAATVARAAQGIGEAVGQAVQRRRPGAPPGNRLR